jgi:isoleucyl-tRNA synthetase
MSEETGTGSVKKSGPGVKVAPGEGWRRVEPWFDLVALEHEVLDLWEETDAFRKLIERNRGGPRFSFLDGPITANNPMGVHHAWGRTLKDAFQRYHAMNGKELRYQNGFDCQGLWVEVEVEKEKGFKEKREIEEYGIARFVTDCKERVRKFSAIQTAQSVRLGMWMRWDDSYFTMADENNYTIWSFLRKCHDRGLIYRGADVMPWSGRSGSAYSQMEIIEGRKLVAHTALFVRFPLRDRPGESLLVWTTTPWTLTSNVAAAVNVDLEYARVREKRSGQVLVFAAGNLDFARLDRQFREKKEWIDGVPKLKTIAQILNERGGYEVLGTVKGKELVGLAYDGPFDELPATGMPGGFPYPTRGVTTSAREAHRVIDGGRDSRGEAIVVLGEGTGIVHIAPGCGDVDHALGTALGLPKLAPLDEAACFLPPFGFLAGRLATARETVDAVLADLKEKGLLVATEQYPHVYPHCWRTGDELVFRLVDEWYIDMGWRDEIKKVVEEIRWIPEWGKERELEWLSGMRDWMISKKRFWGLALPIWVCEKCESFEVLGGREELKGRAIEGWAEFEGHSPHRPWIDGVKIACPKCGGKAHRVKDVGNPWLDAGIVPYSTVAYGTDREYWKKWIPADLVLECFPGQFRNWFYALLSMSTMMEGVAPFKTLLGHALVRDEKGREMHKSWGNAIWFDDAVEQHGADSMRWLYVGQDPVVNLSFGPTPLKNVRGRFLNTLWNTYGFFVNYARLTAWRPDSERIPFGELPDFDRYILTGLGNTVTAARKAIEDYDMRSASQAIEAFVDDLSTWYVRLNRRRFWGSGEEPDCRAALQTLFECLETVTRLAAPMIPFVTEAIWQNLSRGADASAPASVHLAAYPVADPARMDETILAEMRAARRLTSLALSAREAKKLKVRQPLAKLAIGPADETEARAAARFEATLREELNVKAVEVHPPKTAAPLSYRAQAVKKSLAPKAGRDLAAVVAAIVADAERLAAGLRAGDRDLAVRLGDRPFPLGPEDLALVAAAPDGLSVAEDGGTWVAFDTAITADLRTEGLMREILRKLQVLRKDSGLNIEDRIRLRWSSASPEVARVFATHGAFLATELLAVEMERTEGSPGAAEIDADGHALSVSVERTE